MNGTVNELRNLAKAAGIIGYYKMKKQDLKDALGQPRKVDCYGTANEILEAHPGFTQTLFHYVTTRCCSFFISNGNTTLLGKIKETKLLLVFVVKNKFVSINNLPVDSDRAVDMLQSDKSFYNLETGLQAAAPKPGKRIYTDWSTGPIDANHNIIIDKALGFAKEKTTDKFYFYSKSKDAAPGKGAKEEVQNSSDYKDLASIKDWRKILSNFHVCPFKYRGYTYNTIEHVFQSVKIALADKQAAYRFTIESKDPIGAGDGAVAQKNRKLIVLDHPILAKWGAMSEKIMKEAAIAKYDSCPEARLALIATGKAELWHIVARTPHPVRFKHLEQIRATLK